MFIFYLFVGKGSKKRVTRSEIVRARVFLKKDIAKDRMFLRIDSAKANVFLGRDIVIL